MSEKLGSKVEHGVEASEISTNHETQVPKAEQTDAKVEKKLNVQETRETINRIHGSSAGQLDESAESAAKILSVPLPNFAPVIDTITKTWSSIRQNLSPTDKTFSKVIHNPVVSSITEATAKTLARPYAILSGGVTAVLGSGIYLYYTRHLGYRYNYFVPILLFGAGLVASLLVELSYKLLVAEHKK